MSSRSTTCHSLETPSFTLPEGWTAFDDLRFSNTAFNVCSPALYGFSKCKCVSGTAKQITPHSCRQNNSNSDEGADAAG
eukprot:8869465-Karenia_brevis.AAC.1